MAKLVLAGILGVVGLVMIIGSITDSSGPSVADLRSHGYTDCIDFRDSLGPQVVDSSVKCIEGGKLIEFQDSRYHVG
jgi:hypothetical protein